MKGSVIGAIGVVIILIVAGLVLFRSAGDDALAPTATPPITVEEDDLMAPDLNDFLQATPDSVMEDSAAVGDETSEAANDDVLITMDDSTGFTPANVTIQAGTTVTFINNGQALHWPASDVHPTHEILPEFDSKRGLATGETYSYTFTEAGTWAMHDHLMPRFSGTITVE